MNKYTDRTEGKTARQAAILEAVTSEEIATQNDLVKALKKRGISATQVSVSRDVAELGLLTAGGAYRPGAAATGAARALAAAPAGPAGRVLSDAEVLGVVMAAGGGGLNAAELAAERARGDAVKSLAARTRQELEDAREEAAQAAARAGLTPADSATSLQMTKSASDEAVRLGGLGRDDFDGAYLDAEAADEAALLRALDEQLLPSARDRSIAALLKRVRAATERRLDHIRRLQAAGVKSPS